MQGEQVPEDKYEPFRLKQKIEEMIQYGRPLTMNFSRKNRDLADEIRVTMKDMYHLAVELEKKYYRKTTAKELDIALDWLRHLIRMASNREYCGANYAPPLSEHQYEVWARHNREIGNLIGGYIKSLDQ